MKTNLCVPCRKISQGDFVAMEEKVGSSVYVSDKPVIKYSRNSIWITQSFQESWLLRKQYVDFLFGMNTCHVGKSFLYGLRFESPHIQADGVYCFSEAMPVQTWCSITHQSSRDRQALVCMQTDPLPTSIGKSTRVGVGVSPTAIY